MNQDRSAQLSFARSFSAIFLPMAAIIFLITMIIYYSQSRSEKFVTESRETDRAILAQKSIASEFSAVISDLMILTESPNLTNFIGQSSPGSRAALTQEFIRFSRWRRVYDQIRFIDTAGHERIRVNRGKEGRVIAVPEGALQHKGDRYYFNATVGLAPNAVFVSPFDLNVEGGRIENPLKPMIRFGMPVIDDAGNRQGIILLNFLGRRIFDRIDEISAGTISRLLLVNTDGFWLKGLSAAEEWGFMYPDRADLRFGKPFPAAWNRIATGTSGQFRTPEGMFTFATLSPLAQAAGTGSGPSAPIPAAGRSPYQWKIITWIAPDLINIESKRLLRNLLLFDLVIGVIIGIGALFTTRTNIRHWKARQLLRKSREQYRDLVETVEDWIWETGEDGRYTYSSPRVKDLLGYTPGEILGKLPFDFMPEEEAVRMAGIFEAHTKTKSGFSSLETICLNRAGEKVLIETSAVPFFDHMKRFSGWRGVDRNVSDRKLAETERMEREKLEGVLEMAGAVCHELNQPLQSISGYTELILLDSGKENPALGKLTKIKSQVGRMAEITSQLMRVTKYETKAYLNGRIIDIARSATKPSTGTGKEKE